jgi:hypothetical protein
LLVSTAHLTPPISPLSPSPPPVYPFSLSPFIRRTGDDSNPNGPDGSTSVRDVLALHKKWRVGHENGTEADTLWRKFKCRDDKAGHQLLEAVQGALYTTNEKGCQIRRETQGLYYMCCDGVRVRLNEPKHEVLVEVPMPTHAEVEECNKTLSQIEALVGGLYKLDCMLDLSGLYLG